MKRKKVPAMRNKNARQGVAAKQAKRMASGKDKRYGAISSSPTTPGVANGMNGRRTPPY